MCRVYPSIACPAENNSLRSALRVNFVKASFECTMLPAALMNLGRARERHKTINPFGRAGCRTRAAVARLDGALPKSPQGGAGSSRESRCQDQVWLARVPVPGVRVLAQVRVCREGGNSLIFRDGFCSRENLFLVRSGGAGSRAMCR